VPLSLPSSVLQPISLHYCFSLADHKQRLSRPPVCLCVRPSIPSPPARQQQITRANLSLSLLQIPHTRNRALLFRV
jgi:hypothetical protein